MGSVRYSSLLIVITAVSWISIYLSNLDYRFSFSSVLRQPKQIVNSYKKWEEKSEHVENKSSMQMNLLQNSSQCDNCTTNIRSHKPPSILKYSSLNRKDIWKYANKRKIWISMGLCFSKNTEMYGKRDYPYAQVTPLAIILWYHFFPDINIILYLVYDKRENEDRRKLYEEQLRQTKVEIRWVKSEDMNCVTKSQLIRMWAFQEPIIRDEDIIITVDVNLFVATPNILDPIYENPDLKIWNFQWHRAAFVNTTIGETFNQNLISAESKGGYDV